MTMQMVAPRPRSRSCADTPTARTVEQDSALMAPARGDRSVGSLRVSPARPQRVRGGERQGSLRPAPIPGSVRGPASCAHSRAVVRESVMPAVSARHGYRMSRWERLAMTATIVTAAVVALVVVLSGGNAVGNEVVVRSGDTLLSIALSELPGVDPARAAELIMDASGLGDLALRPGMTLIIPELPAAN